MPSGKVLNDVGEAVLHQRNKLDHTYLQVWFQIHTSPMPSINPKHITPSFP